MAEEVKDPGVEEIFTGGPTKNEVDQWKSQHGDVYISEVGSDTFIWRPCSRKEWKDILKIQNADPLYREERLMERCLLWPKGYDFTAMARGKAGVPSQVSDQIMEKSGFSQMPIEPKKL